MTSHPPFVRRKRKRDDALQDGLDLRVMLDCFVLHVALIKSIALTPASRADPRVKSSQARLAIAFLVTSTAARAQIRSGALEEQGLTLLASLFPSWLRAAPRPCFHRASRKTTQQTNSAIQNRRKCKSLQKSDNQHANFDALALLKLPS